MRSDNILCVSIRNGHVHFFSGLHLCVSNYCSIVLLLRPMATLVAIITTTTAQLYPTRVCPSPVTTVYIAPSDTISGVCDIIHIS